MSIITFDQLQNAATKSRAYSDEVGAALYTLANTANTVAVSASNTAASAYALANTASNMTLYGSYDSADESITFELG